MKGFIGRRGWTSWKVMSEKKRKRDITNKMKKNNAKMQESRKQWEDPNTKSDKIDGDEAISSAEAKFGNAGESNKKSDIDDQEKEATLEQGKDLKKDGEDVKNGEPEKEPKLEQGEGVKEVVENDVWVSSPPSWNEADLLKRAQTRGLIQYDSWEEVPEIARGRIRESCFPPTPEEIEKFQLHKCKRCLPHDLDTGGFFVALFLKVSPLSERAKRKAEMLAKGCASTTDSANEKNRIMRALKQ